MAKVLYFSDVHIMGVSPASRIDNFPETILNKLIEVREIGAREGVDAFLCGGDLFDSPNCPTWMVYKLVEIFKTYPAPIYGIVGNHDIYGWELKSIDRSQIGVLIAAGVYKSLDLMPATEQLKIGRFDITGGPLDNKDASIDSLFRFVDANEDPDRISIHLIHHSILPSSRYLQGGIRVEDIDPAVNLDLLLVGHVHMGYGEHVSAGGTCVYNAGSLARVTRDENGYVNDQVKILLIQDAPDKETGTKFTTSEVFLKTSRPLSEVFKQSGRADLVQARPNLGSLLSGVNLTNFKSVSGNNDAVQLLMNNLNNNLEMPEHIKGIIRSTVVDKAEKNRVSGGRE